VIEITPFRAQRAHSPYNIFDVRLAAGLWLCCGFRMIHRAFKPFANGDCDRSSGLHSIGSKYCFPDACGDATKLQNFTYCDEHSREGGHDLGMLHDDVVYWLARIQRLLVRHRCGDLGDPTWQSMTWME
jgi:hypothetical protein